MDLFRSTCCRHGLQRVYGAQQRRTLFSHHSFFRWSSPVGNFKKPPREKTIEVPSGVTTLDPRRFTEAQYFDISQSPLRNCFRKMRPTHIHDPHGRQFGDQMSTTDTLFPPDTRGFLYFRSVPNQSPLAGAVRFRVAEKPDKASFLAGHDLLMSHGLPWQLPIWEIVIRPAFKDILDILAADGFAPEGLQLACNSFNIVRDSVFIAALGEPWAVDWATEFSRVYFVRPFQHPIPSLIRHPWFNSGTERKAPCTGRGLVSVVQTTDGRLGLRIDKVLSLKQHTITRGTIIPAEGLVTEFQPRLIHKSTKVSELRMDSMVGSIIRPVSKMPWAAGNPNPFEIYRHDIEHTENLLSLLRPQPSPRKGLPPRKDLPPHRNSGLPLSPPSRGTDTYPQNRPMDAAYNSQREDLRPRSSPHPSLPPARAADTYARSGPSDAAVEYNSRLGDSRAQFSPSPSRAPHVYSRNGPWDSATSTQGSRDFRSQPLSTTRKTPESELESFALGWLPNRVAGAQNAPPDAARPTYNSQPADFFSRPGADTRNGPSDAALPTYRR
ncbi:hypothetical protein B0H19DRAFT_1154041 [Mycena capillaripes]|nr:hypothetical protein B0H19DRAFT_1154041 [Mycena capillaripes]